MKKSRYIQRKRLIDWGLKLGLPWFRRHLQNHVYDADFFLEANTLKEQSAQKVAEILAGALSFQTVFDIGCGMGLYLAELSKLGKICTGCDASPDGVRMASADVFVFRADATRPIQVNRKSDLVICFEVAEHIAKRHSRQLVRNCTAHGRQVAFTAAPPGQGGVGHINEQPYEFWISLFGEQGFKHDSALSGRIREQMASQGVVSWIANNLMIFNGPNAA